MSSSKVWGRVDVRGWWRPASLEDGTMYVSPASDRAWREPTDDERGTWQERVAASQRTVGRIWDDALYVA